MRNLKLRLCVFLNILFFFGCSSALERKAEEWEVESESQVVVTPDPFIEIPVYNTNSCDYQPDFPYCLKTLPCPNSTWINLDDWLCYPLEEGFFSYKAQKVDYCIVDDAALGRAEEALQRHAIRQVDKTEALGYCQLKEWNGIYDKFYIVRSVVLDNWAAKESITAVLKDNYLYVNMHRMGRGPGATSKRAIVVNLPLEPPIVYVGVTQVE